ncbi:hypothetical protein H8356DRAFT_1328479 [Neocallimastix lanati (nom. inval.)]|nr:hypothetical protein H8356DRAFT_1328479 [Neocallimastix sp. JGI-2020a]
MNLETDIYKEIIYDFKITALIKVCNINPLVFIKYLIDHDADISKENKNGDITLIKVSHNENSSIIKYLIEHRSDLAKGNKNEEIKMGIYQLNITYKIKKINE